METIAYIMPKDAQREYRSVGHFSVEEVRNLAPGPTDAIALGCPPALFLEVLEKRAAIRAGRPVVAAPVVTRHKFVPTEAQRNAVLDRVRRIRLANATALIESQDRALAGLNPAVTLTDEQRRKRAADVAAKIYADEVAEWSKTKQWS